MNPLLDELRAAGHLTGDIAEPDGELAVSRWILALQAVGGWLASVFLLSFVALGAASFVKGGGGWLTIGMLATVLAGLGLRQARSTLLRQFLLPLSLAGQAAFAMGVAQLFKTDASGWWLLALFEIAVCCAVPWPMHRFLAAISAVFLIQMALIRTLSMSHEEILFSGWVQSVYWALACLLLSSELHWRTKPAAGVVAAFAAAFTVHCLASVSLPFAFELGGSGWLRNMSGAGWGLPLVSFVCLAFLGRRIWNSSRGFLLLAALAGALAITWQSPGIGVGMTAMVLAFAHGHRWLVWAGGVITLIAIGRYYYFLPVDLLSKSGYLVLGGSLLLGVRQLIVSGGEKSHA